MFVDEFSHNCFNIKLGNTNCYVDVFFPEITGEIKDWKSR